MTDLGALAAWGGLEAARGDPKTGGTSTLLKQMPFLLINDSH
ncbi:hypothetical protein Q669_18995 [Labrenzia sp. C1B10]|nr:hypothetical protein Q669_18995 [Labrenzia sp. C1B10]ERP99900.1 hypothetical protein Q675_10070 [Labrenzia sp. C1B70]